MALISNAVTRGSLTEEQLDEAFSADRRSVDLLSTDFDSSTEGSVGGDSSLWESSDHDDIIGDESDDKSTQFSGSFSDCYKEQVNDLMNLYKQLAQNQVIQAQREMMKDLLHATS